MTSIKHLLTSALALALFSCGGQQLTRDGGTSLTGPVDFSLSQGQVWRTANGIMVRAHFVVANGGHEPAVIVREAVLAENLSTWFIQSSFPERVEVASGSQVTGSLVWFDSGDVPPPSAVNVFYGLWRTMLPLRTVQLPTPENEVLKDPESGEFLMTADGTATTYRDPDDNSHMVRIPVRLQNGLNHTVELDPSQLFGFRNEEHEGSFYETGLPTPLQLAPGESISGHVIGYFDEESPKPQEISLRIGSYPAPVSMLSVTLTDAPTEPGDAPEASPDASVQQK